MIEILLLLGAILGGLAVILAFQVRKMLIAKQVDITDLDAVIKALFELEFDRAFFVKIAIGTGIGAFGAFASLAALVAGAPADGNELALIAYGFAWGFGGSGILYVIRMVPEGFVTILNLNNQVKALRAEISGLKEQNSVLKSHVETVSQNNGQVPLK
jgi:hypothetical protein